MHALHVELCTALPVTLVQTNNLGSEDVIAGSKCGNLHGVLTLLAGVAAGEELVDSPFLAVEGVFPELGPGKGRAGFTGVDHDGALVGLWRSQ